MPPEPSLRSIAVAAVEQGADQPVFGVGGHGVSALPFDAGGRIACISCFAIGAATAPPKPFVLAARRPRRRRRAGFSAGAKKMNQASYTVLHAQVSAVPVLPATTTPGICARCAGARLHDLDHHVLQIAPAVCGFVAVPEHVRVQPLDHRAAGREHLLDQRRPHHDALVRDRRGDHRHLQRRRQHLLLPEGEAARVDLREAVSFGSKSLPLRRRGPRPSARRDGVSSGGVE